MSSLFKTLIGQIVVSLAAFGVVYLTVTSVRFDIAILILGGLLGAIILLIYWPRRTRRDDNDLRG